MGRDRKPYDVKSAEYGAWSRAKRSGLPMAAEWYEDFAAFLGEVGERPSKDYQLKLRDREQGYRPGNVYWRDAGRERAMLSAQAKEDRLRRRQAKLDAEDAERRRKVEARRSRREEQDRARREARLERERRREEKSLAEESARRGREQEVERRSAACDLPDMSGAGITGSVDLINVRFGDYVVIARGPNVKHRSSWLCRCIQCDEMHAVLGANLRNGRAKHCPKHRRPSSGHNVAVVDDSDPEEKKCREWSIWRGMLYRCHCETNPDYPFYGGKGIVVAERWRTYSNFLADMGRSPGPEYSIDRLDRHYVPGACRWATMQEQARNRGNNITIELEGETKCLAELAEEHDLPFHMVHQRLTVLGWDVESSLTTPPTPNGKAIEYDGVEYPSLKAAARAHGLAYHVLHDRLRRGWDLRAALTTPARGQGGD